MPDFYLVGASPQLGAIIDFSDPMLFTMAPNSIVGLCILALVVEREHATQWAKMRRAPSGLTVRRSRPAPDVAADGGRAPVLPPLRFRRP